MMKAYGALHPGRKKLLLGIVLVLVMAGLWGCGSKVTLENFEKIKNGMTLAEVTALLGEPGESYSLNVGPLSGTTTKWQAQDGTTIAIQFVNGKVVAKQLLKGGEK